ncbi:RlpA-like double-psi beta-barrel-protein domain-containing protein-containing protein [Mycena epipterygia]|nr:RlpA-like double-psi beta-barrel-protein domain-containing protein-containing protein [Mycena epipterygia]
MADLSRGDELSQLFAEVTSFHAFLSKSQTFLLLSEISEISERPFISLTAGSAHDIPIQNSDFSVALSSAHYDSGAHCGKDITVTYKGKSITVKVEDLCPGCVSTGIDLTEGAFASLANTDLGVIDVTWKFD